MWRKNNAHQANAALPCKCMKVRTCIITFVIKSSLLTLCHPAAGQVWIQATNFSANGVSLASSADGSKVVAAFENLTGIYSSINGGQTWTWLSNSVQFGSFPAIACSADGNFVVAGNYTNNTIYTSTNGGVTWTSNNVASSKGWYSIASSADGTRLVAAPNGPGPIFTSSDAGTTWRSNNVPNTSWYGVACSADGGKVVAADPLHMAVYASTDFGTNWTMHSTAPVSLLSVASSADGMKLVAGAYGGPTFTSTNAGTTWIANDLPWVREYCVATSAEGDKLAAADQAPFGETINGPIYTSTNGGVTWVSNNVPPLGWSSIVSSADGRRLAAASLTAIPGAVYVFQAPPAPKLNIASADHNVLVSWVLPSQPFTLQQTTDLTTSNWTAVTNTPVLNLTNLQEEVVVPISAGNAFYRLETSP